MTEADSDFFFGRTRETIEVIRALEASPDKLPLLLGNSGVGKSSLAQAGVMAALARQGWPDNAGKPGPWPQAFRNSRRWCFLTMRPGAEPIKALVEAFLDAWQVGSIDPERVKQQNGWIELFGDSRITLRDLLDATERRYKELGQPKPSAFFLYLDQGEELYVRAEEHQRRRFSEVLAQGVGDPRLYALMSLRADFFGELQKDTPLYKAHRQINVPPLGEAELPEVVTQPARLLSARFETDHLAADIANRAAEESTREAEYEYAARAGTQTAYPWGNDSRAEVLRRVVPGTAAEHTETATACCPGRAVRRRPIVAVVVTILSPRPDVAYHIEETEGVGGK
jgi:hypothetical protein